MRNEQTNNTRKAAQAAANYLAWGSKITEEMLPETTRVLTGLREAGLVCHTLGRERFNSAELIAGDHTPHVRCGWWVSSAGKLAVAGDGELLQAS